MNIKLEPIRNGYQIYIRFQYQGKQYRKKQKFIGTKPEARRKAQKLFIELEEKAHKKKVSGSLTLKECINFYREHTELNKQPKSYLKLLEENLGDINIEDLKKPYLEFLRYLSQTKTKKGTPYKEGTLNRYTGTLQSVIKCVFKWGLIKEKPFSSGDIPHFKTNARDEDLTEEKMR